MHQLGRRSICNDWEFVLNWVDGYENGEGTGEAVRIPHNVGELPLHYCDPEDYSYTCGYRRHLFIDGASRGKRLFLQFDAAAHRALVYINGREAAAHLGGYTAFRIEITDLVKFGEDNIIAVKLNTQEDPAIPPFGFVIDYLCYGGLYREVWYEERSSSYIEDVFVTTPHPDELVAAFTTDGSYDKLRLTLRPASEKYIFDEALRDEADLAGAPVVCAEYDAAYDSDGGNVQTVSLEIKEKIRIWSPGRPALYSLTAELIRDGEVVDTVVEITGFRNLRWKSDGLYLNGRRFFFRGLNRHQCYPHLGYAASASLQYEDARILKEELACNAVRTSHYPQSQFFIDACDRLGLLVFTEIPGWQHIGDSAWKDIAIENVREMVLQYRNHPSIMLWGVRINESGDDDEFYTKTNAVAHELDPSRDTSGVRYRKMSNLLEDVYAYNDFSHNGSTPGCLPPDKVTPDMSKPFLISEANGHMFPTKAFDNWERRQEQALRHARVMEAAMASGKHAGVFQWCMFDYQTHGDSGNGDRICYHGVMDHFRNPKLASALYTSQGDEKPFIEIGSTMDIGDYDAADMTDVYIFTNCDEVRMYKNGCLVTVLTPDTTSALAHPPILVDDYVGDMLETVEGFSKTKAKAIKGCLFAAKHGGISNLSLRDKALFGYTMMRHGLSFDQGVALYGKYIANWGSLSIEWRFDGIKDGEVVCSAVRGPKHDLHLEVTQSTDVLREGDTYDTAALRVRVLDGGGTVASYSQPPIIFTVPESLEICGPSIVTAEGGMCGTYLKTKKGTSGTAEVTVASPGLESVTVSFELGGVTR